MRNAFYITLLMGTVLSSNVLAGTNEDCQDYCKSGSTCDCTWDASTNTLTVNSGVILKVTSIIRAVMQVF